MRNFPKQRVPYTTKIKDDYSWAKQCIDALLINYSNSNDSLFSDYERKLSNYQLFNNQLNQKDFERECNPLGIEVGQFRDEIQPYNKTYNKIQVLLGEELTRPFNYKVILTDPEGVKSKLAYRDQLLREYVTSKIQEVLQQLQISSQDQVDPSTVMDPSKIDSYMSTSYLSSREILASKLLKYLYKELDIPHIKNDAYKHGLISGEEIVRVYKRFDVPYVEVLNSLGVIYDKSAETKFIQDGFCAGYRTLMLASDVLDLYGSYLSKEDLDRIDNMDSAFRQEWHKSPNNTMMYYNDANYYDSKSTYPPTHEASYGDSHSNQNEWLVQHIEWKTQKKVGFIKYTNSYGDRQLDIVNEDFELPTQATKLILEGPYNKKTTVYTWAYEGITYTYEDAYIPEVWEGTRIGEDIYAKIGPTEYQFRSLDNPYDVKLSYHGLVYSGMNATPISPMDRMKPFQYLYFIVMHKLKKLLAQDKGRVFHFDTSMVDPKLGLDKTLYYLTNLNIDFYNPLQNANEPGWSQRGKISGSTDMSVADQVVNYINILAAIDQQISEVSGVNPQREGNIAANEAVTNAQANVQMSAVSTAVYFEAHDKLWEHILNSLLSVAQTCFKHNSVTKQFVLDDLSIATLDFTPDSLSNSSFGVFVTSSPKEFETFNSLKGLAQALIQTDKAKFSDIIAMLQASSTEELKREILQSEKNSQLAEQQQYQVQKEMQQADQAFQFEYQARELDTKVQVAEIQSFARQANQDINNDNIPDQLEIEELRANIALKSRKLDLDEKKLKQEKELREKEIAAKKSSRAIS